MEDYITVISALSFPFYFSAIDTSLLYKFVYQQHSSSVVRLSWLSCLCWHSSQRFLGWHFSHEKVCLLVRVATLYYVSVCSSKLAPGTPNHIYGLKWKKKYFIDGTRSINVVGIFTNFHWKKRNYENKNILIWSDR